MGSIRQDALHEQFLRECEEEVVRLEREVAASSPGSESYAGLVADLAGAKQDLAVQKAIDAKRD